MEVEERLEKQQGLMASLHGLLSTTNPAVKKLMGWRVCEDEEKWAEKAVESLVKKLKKNREALGELVRAVSDPGRASGCVAIPRSMDGRLQVSHRKGLPHVIYCKLWRWSDLQSQHELRSLPLCRFPFSAKLEQICVNPYHYQRLESPRLPSVLVPRSCPPAPALQAPAGFLHDKPDMRPTMPRNVSVPDVDASGRNLHQFTPTPNTALPLQCQQIQSSQIQNGITIPYSEPCEWASITYYELNTRVGEIFRCGQPVITVDGFTDPTSSADRFCLGKLSNVNRNSVIENTRRYIGHGIQLHYVDGKVILENHSNHSVFMQSRNFNFQQNYADNAVAKINSSYTCQIFDNVLFGNILEQKVYHGYEAVNHLVHMCTIRISFVKGWGADYHRNDVTATPCWIEILLHGPLKWLDVILKEMNSPLNHISSIS